MGLAGGFAPARAMTRMVIFDDFREVTRLRRTASLPARLDSAQGLTIAIPEQLQNEAARPCQYAWTFKIQSLNA